MHLFATLTPAAVLKGGKKSYLATHAKSAATVPTGVQ
jgi:hypothetical protein